MKLESYLAGRWQAGHQAGRALVNPTTGAEIARADATGLDLAAAVEFARARGGAALAAMGFAGRADMLRAVADLLTAGRDDYYAIARENSGNTAADAAVDIDGAIFTLKTYARIGKSLGGGNMIVEPGQEQLIREADFMARHVWTARPGIAVQINAFNFPAWGMWEKAAQSLLAGMPFLAKPATSTAMLAERMVRDVVAAKVMPEGAVSLLCGGAGELVDALGPMDSIAFTGSAETGAILRAQIAQRHAPPRLTVEADSINATIIGPDVAEGGELFVLALREAERALSVKAGQLCTNIRRIFVPARLAPAFAAALAARAERLVVGDPADKATRVGPLVNAEQRDQALRNIGILSAEARVIGVAKLPDVAPGSGFVAPTVLLCDDPGSAKAVHEVEVFGPCVTVVPYGSLEDAAALGAQACGSLALSLFSGDAEVQRKVVTALAPWHGRVLLVDETVGRTHTGHGIVMPQCVHGGPGRAGGGEELGGLRGLRLHMQRTAVQCRSAALDAIFQDAAKAAL